MGVDGARFRKPVVPGDRLQLDIEVIRHKGAIWKTKGTATVDGVKVAEGEFLATVVDKDKAASRTRPRPRRPEREDETPMAQVHPTAVVHPGARLHETVEVGAVRGHRAEGDDRRGHPRGPPRRHRGRTTLGERNRIFPFASVGAAPQDLKYAGEDTRARHRRRQHHPRVRHAPHRHGGRRRASPGWATATSSWPTATWPTTAWWATAASSPTAWRSPGTWCWRTSSSSAACRRCTSSPASASTPSSPAAPWWRWTCRPTAPPRGTGRSSSGLNTVGLQRHGFTEEQMARMKEAYKILFRSKLRARRGARAAQGGARRPAGDRLLRRTS